LACEIQFGICPSLVMITAALSYWEQYFWYSIIAFVCMLPVCDHNST